MADDPAKLFQQVMDAARREGRAEGRTEGFAEGFAAAMRMVQEFSASAKPPGAGKPREGAARSAASAQEPSIPKGRIRISDAPYAPRIAGDKADQLVEDAYQFIAPKAAGPTEIQHIIKQRGADLPGTSVRRAIGRLTDLGRLRRLSERTWVYLSPDTSNGGDGDDNESTRQNAPKIGTKASNGATPAHP